MATNKIGTPSQRTTWIGGIREQRPQAPAAKGATKGAAKGARGDKDLLVAGGRGAPGAERLQGAFEAAQVPEKLSKEFGKELEGALPEIGGLAALGQDMEPWRKKQLDRALGQAYKILGLQLTLAAPENRARVAKETLGALLDLAKETGANEHLMPAIFAATGLVDSGARLVAQKKLRQTADQAASAARDAAGAVSSLASTLTGRSGVAAALNVFPNLVEQLERGAAELTPAKRAALWKATAAFLEAAVPKRGFDQASAARLSALVTEALQKGATPERALKQAKETLEAEWRPLHAQATAQLAVEVPNLSEIARTTYDHVVYALGQVLEANPSGPPELYDAVEALRGAAAQHVAWGDHEHVQQAWGCVAAILRNVASSPAIDETLRALRAIADQAPAHPQIGPAFQRAVDAPSFAEAAKGIVEAQLAAWNRVPGQYPGLDQAIERLGDLDANVGLAVLAATLGQLANPPPAAALVAGTVDAAKTARPEDLGRYLSDYAARFSAYASRFQAWIGANDRVWALAAAFAKGTAGDKIEQAVIDVPAQMLRGIQQLPKVDLLQLLGPDAAGRPGLLELTDPSVRYRHPIATIYENLTAGLRWQLQQRDQESQTETTRLALGLAQKLALLDGDYRVPYGRVQGDFSSAILNPGGLRFAARPQNAVALRAQQQPSVSAFLEAHPELPLELAFTAGIHLSPEQIAWVGERVAGARGRDTVRSLRDFVFACVSANHLDLLDAVRASNSPAKAVSAVITEVGRDYRANKLNEIPWADLTAGLAAGGDPVAELREKRVAQGMVGLDAAALAGGKPDEAGLEVLGRCGAAITSCLQYYAEQKKNPNTDGRIDYAPVESAFIDVLRSVASGTWPKVKYENEVGKRQLAILTPEQQDIWRHEVLAAPGGAPIGFGETLAGTMQLLKGLVKALPMEVRLSKGVGELGWNARSAERLQKKRDELLGELRQNEKGSPKHRELGIVLGEVNRNLAVLELYLALEARFQKGAPSDPKKALTELRPLLSSAASALRSLGARGSAQAVTEATFAARDLKGSVRQGRFAVDEDSLEALILSHTQASGSCLNHVSGFRRWGLSGAAADANIRMLRSYEGEKFGYRAFLKLFPVELEGYQGPALWIDRPLKEGPGTPEDLSLLYKAAIAKAEALGVPVLGSEAQLVQEGQQAGHPTKVAQVTFLVDEGNTGAQHSDVLFGGVGNVRAGRGAEAYWRVARQVQVVLPKVPNP